MRIFTKSLFTFVLLCVAGVVNAQNTVKGWFEVDVEFISKEILDGGEVMGPARIEDGAYVIYSNGEESQDYGTQAFLTIGKNNALKEGAKFRLRMQVKADSEASGLPTQAHQAPGTYNHYECAGSINFTDSWELFDSGEKTVSGDMGKGDGFYTVAINLGQKGENNYYFKDIVFEIYGDKPATPTVVSQKWQWTEMINNNDCEGTDNSSYWYRTFPYNKGDQAINAEIVDGAGKEGRGVKVVTTECGDIDNQYDSANDIGGHAWDNQFWFSFNEEIPAGAHYKVSFDYRAEEDLTVGTQAHNTPGEYNHYQMFGDLNFTSEWKTYTGEGDISGDQSKEDKPMLSVAFNLNTDQNHNEPAHTFYFDNLSFKTGYLINDVRNDEVGGFRILFTEYTNMPDLVKSIMGKKRRAVLPEAIGQAAVKITVDGVEVPVEVVEYDKDGSLYAFFSEDNGTIADGANIVVTFTNPEDAKYRLVYTRGDNLGNAVENFEQESQYDGQIDILPSSWLSPELEESDPEDGSFCLPANTKSFVLTFDKPVKAAKMQAKLDGSENLTVVPDGENAAAVRLMRAPNAADLAEGKHKINVTKVYSVNDDAEYEDSPVELSFSVGEPAVDAKLQRALDAAQVVLEESEDARYQGEAFAALQAAVDKYNAEAINYTKPSEVQAALDELSGKNEAQTQHYNRCKNYDDNLAGAEELVAGYGESKFAAHPLFAELSAAVAKYSGKVLTDDAQLEEANKDLEANVNKGKAMFTEGKPSTGKTGIAALVERIRQGAETLQTTFGAADDDELIVAANKVLDDDDALANSIKNRITVELYDKLKNGADDLFSESEVDGKTIGSGPNMTVFVKNPNIYRLTQNKDINTAENAVNTPQGWTINSGSTKLSDGWSQANADIADTMFEGWGATFDISQDITGLPTGVYQMNFAIGERVKGNATKKVVNEETGEEEEVADDEKNEADLAGIYAYVKTSDDEEIVKQSVPYIGQSFPTLSQNRVIMNGIVVKDGKLTIGFHGEGASIFMEEVQLTLVGAADGVNYADELEKFKTGIETVKIADSAVFYDLQGRRVAAPSKGLYIKNNKKVVIK